MALSDQEARQLREAGQLEALLHQEGWGVLQQHLDARKNRLKSELFKTRFTDLAEVSARQAAIEEINLLEGYIRTVIERGRKVAERQNADNSGTGS